ncbi:MAG TPA: flagellar protein FlaG [Bordetella sp.]
MDVSPILSTPASLPVQAVPVTPIEPIAPATGSAKGSGADSSTSQQQGGSNSSIDKALQSLNDEMQAWSTQLQFNFDPDLHRVVVSIVDSKTGKTINTIPSETVLRIAKMITKFEGKAVQTEA